MDELIWTDFIDNYTSSLSTNSSGAERRVGQYFRAVNTSRSSLSLSLSLSADSIVPSPSQMEDSVLAMILTENLASRY